MCSLLGLDFAIYILDFELEYLDITALQSTADYSHYNTIHYRRYMIILIII